MDSESPANWVTDESSLDARFELLANGRRRLLLRYLLAVRVAEFEECTAHVLESDPETSPGDWETVALELRHVHVPKLATSGVVECDERSGVLRYRGDPIVESCLDVVVDEDLEPMV